MRSGARIVAATGLLTSAACVLALHVARSDVPPLSHRLSAYAIGPDGWLMTLAFVTLGCGLAALGPALVAAPPRGAALIVPILSSVAGAGMVVSAVFETDVTPSSDLIHSRASISATVALVVLVVAYAVPPTNPWFATTADRADRWLAVGVVVLLMLAPLLHDTEWTGLGQRLLWIVLLAWSLRALAKRSPAAPDEPDRRSTVGRDRAVGR